MDQRLHWIVKTYNINTEYIMAVIDCNDERIGAVLRNQLCVRDLDGVL